MSESALLDASSHVSDDYSWQCRFLSFQFFFNPQLIINSKNKKNNFTSFRVANRRQSNLNLFFNFFYEQRNKIKRKLLVLDHYSRVVNFPTCHVGDPDLIAGNSEFLFLYTKEKFQKKKNLTCQDSKKQLKESKGPLYHLS